MGLTPHRNCGFLLKKIVVTYQICKISSNLKFSIPLFFTTGLNVINEINKCTCNFKEQVEQQSNLKEACMQNIKLFKLYNACTVCIIKTKDIIKKFLFMSKS